MKSVSTPLLPRLARAAKRTAWLGLALSGTVLAATTDLSNAPLFTSSATAVKPNIMFILDDSGSMKSDYLPDEASQFTSSTYGRKAVQCNGVAYNPDTVYSLPVDYLGSSVTAASLTFITPDPSSQTDNQRNLGSNINPLPSVGANITVSPQGGTPKSSWYDVGDVVTIFTSSTNYMVGTVTSWNTNRTLKVTITFIAPGASAMTSPKVGDGEPNSATYYKYTGSQPKMGYTYNSAGNVITTSDFYKECISAVGSTPGKNVFTAVTVTTASSEAQNYANWYQYYRTRMAMMKSSISLAFTGIDSRYRLGFSTISEEKAAENTSFLNVRTVDATQKQKFYAAVNAAQPIVYTPLRGALAKAGQYFANKAPSQNYDPIQYSCQRNFTILSTDGYWNTNDEITTAPKYGPYQLDNSTLVGQQDGSDTLRPMLDGQTTTKTTTNTWTVSAVTAVTNTSLRTATSTTSKSTTTVSPVSGFESITYAQTGKVQQISGSNMTRPTSGCSSCYSTFSLSGHGYADGESVTISGGSQTEYRGTYTVDYIDANSFRLALGDRPGGNASGTYTITPSGASSCPVGQRMVTQSRITRDSTTSSIFTATTTTVTISTVTQVVTTTETTPHKQVITEQNGVVTSDTGDVAGALSSNPVNSTPTVNTGTPTVTPSTSTAAGPNGFTNWTSPAVTNVGCTTGTKPADVSSRAIAATTVATKTTSGPTTTPQSQDVAIGSSTGATTTTTTPVTTVFTSNTTGGVENTLADVAMYYYKTDLRTTGLTNCTGSLGTDVCNNNVPGDEDDAAHSYGDTANWQHMTTFTLGLGLNGLLKYDQNYLTQKSGDFFDITNNNKNWPAAGAGQTAENIDDLWHAAVNGRGQYFSAGDPASLSRSLNAALDSIKKITGAASAASTSSLQPVEGDNDIYVAQFTTAQWVGDVLSYKISPTTGGISNTITWSAQARLDAMAPSARKIYYANPATGVKALRTFTYANLLLDGYNGLFDNFCGKAGAGGAAAPTQCSTLGGSLASANLGINLVSYLRGDQSMTYYRGRAHILGDVINASPLFVGKPGFKYTENGYGAWAAGKATRTAVVLAAANDGMVHAFSRDTGDELWSFIPTAVMKNMYKLADEGYANNHQYFVDGSPQIGDIYVNDGSGFDWKTIVVGGLNAGGRSYYALDMTDPSAPKLLWEFTNDDLGYTYGNPIITKRRDGTWVVVIASGYNNVSPGDGNGHLFVLNANTGALITQIQTYTTGTTPAGTAATPSGLAKINSWVDSEVLNVSQRFYGGDLLGNVWRFDLDNQVAPNSAALRLAQLTAPNATAQPITVKPAVAEVVYNSARYPVVYVPTGKYLGTTDLSDNQVQTMYAIKDPLANLPYGVVRTNSAFVTQTLNDTGNAARTGTSKTVDWSTKAGWYVDFPGTGERVSVNPQLALETIYVGTNKPNNDACTVGGNSFLYQFNIASGTSTSSYVGNVLIQGLTLVQLTTGSADGSVVTIITRSDGTLQTQVSAPPTSSINLRRTSWRELVE